MWDLVRPAAPLCLFAAASWAFFGDVAAGRHADGPGYSALCLSLSLEFYRLSEGDA